MSPPMETFGMTYLRGGADPAGHAVVNGIHALAASDDEQTTAVELGAPTGSLYRIEARVTSAGRSSPYKAGSAGRLA